MIALNIEEKRIVKVYTAFRSAMIRNGQTISFPKNTDPRKTYSWRYLKNFLKNIENFNIDDNNISYIVDAIVEHAKRKRLLKRGIAVLDNKNILDICLAKLERDSQNEDSVIIAIKTTHDFLESKRKQDSDISLLDLLMKRSNRRSYANIVRWFQAEQISIGYIAASLTCRKAIAKLQTEEIGLFPTTRQLLKARLKLMSSPSIVSKLKEFMDKDLFKE